MKAIAVPIIALLTFTLSGASANPLLQFKRLGPPPAVSYYGTFAIDPENPDRLFLATRGHTPAGKSASAGLYRSENGGTIWHHHPKVAPAINYGNVGLKIHPKDSNVMFAVSEYQPNFSLSLDHGKTWNTKNAPFKHGISLALDPRDSRTLYVGSDDGVWKSSNQGTSWKSLTNGLPKITKAVSNTATDLLIDPSDPDTLYVGFLYAALDEPWGVYKSVDAGKSWTACNSGLPTDSLKIDLAKGQLRNADGTASQAKLKTPMILSLQHRAVECMALDPTNPKTLYLNTRQKGLFRSRDGAATWQKISLPRFPQNHTKIGAKVMGLLVHPKNPKLLITTTDRLSIFLSHDQGDTWTCAGRLYDVEKQEKGARFILPNGQEFTAPSLDSPKHMGRLRLFTPILHPTDPETLFISGDLGLFEVRIPNLLRK